MPHAFSERLAEGPVLCDGAMGTMLYARGVPLDGCFDVLNLNNLRVVQAVHADYIAAGADAIETNTFGANRFKLAVHGVEAQVREINRRGAQALGANCSVGSSTLYDVLERMVPEAGGLPLAIQPNAGLPSRIGERLIYLSSPAYMADYAGRMVEAGARLVGGCCGTTPQHTAAMRETLDRRIPSPRRVVARAPAPRPAPVETTGIARMLPPTPLARKLEAREFVVTVELDPPRGHTVD